MKKLLYIIDVPVGIMDVFIRIIGVCGLCGAIIVITLGIQIHLLCSLNIIDLIWVSQFKEKFLNAFIEYGNNDPNGILILIGSTIYVLVRFVFQGISGAIKRNMNKVNDYNELYEDFIE